MKNIEKKLREFKIDFKLNESMKKHTSLRIGGEAEYFISVSKEEDLNKIIKFANIENISYFVFGNGTNILVSDKGIKGIVVKNAIKGICFLNGKIKIKAGENLKTVLKKTKEKRLSGMEFAAGIPGTFGGAVLTNAGTSLGCIGDIISKITILNKSGEIECLKKEDLNLNYRENSLKKQGIIILEGEISIREGRLEEIEEKIKFLEDFRRKHQPLNEFSAGSIFKNTEKYAAGYLIEKAGLKNKKIGDAEISSVHANFIVNKGKANAEDILSLMKLVEKEVKDKFGIELEREIELVGEF